MLRTFFIINFILFSDNAVKSDYFELKSGKRQTEHVIVLIVFSELRIVTQCEL